MEEKRRVLIVDDDPGIQDALCMIFEQAGYDTDIHSDGEALLNGDFQLPHLFILDKQLSGVDGLDICRYLKSESRTKDIPVLMLSATPQLEQLALSAGADGFQRKPFPMHELLNQVQQMLFSRPVDTVART